jgi:hypothetical protein
LKPHAPRATPPTATPSDATIPAGFQTPTIGWP